MRRVIIGTLCAVCATSGLAYADLDKGTAAPDFEATEWLNTDEPVSLAELRGMTVVAFFWQGHQKIEIVLPLLNLLNSKIGRSRGMYLVGVTDGDRKMVEPLLKKELVFFPVALESKSAAEYKITGFPHVVVIDANGKITYSGWSASADELVKNVFDTIAETPPTKTHPLEAVIAQDNLRQARVALREDKFRDAYKAAKEAYEHALSGDTLKTDCHDVLELVEALGRDQLAQAVHAAEEKKFDEAVDLLRDVVREFKDMDVARSARRKLDLLKKKYDEVARLMSRDTEAGQAENLLAQALKDLRAQPRRIGEAYEGLERILKEYGSTPAATKAQTVLDRIKKNNGMMDYVRDYKARNDCELMLSQARAYERGGQVNRAKDLYRQVIQKYGDTIYADQAAKRLAQLP
jgi:hypothetical protein